MIGERSQNNGVRTDALAVGSLDVCEGLTRECVRAGPKMFVVPAGHACVISGWLVPSREPARIEVLANDVRIAVAEYGLARPDVATALGNPAAMHCGLRAFLRTDDFEVGAHALSLAYVDFDDRRYAVACDPLELIVTHAIERVDRRVEGFIDALAINGETIDRNETPVYVEAGDVLSVRGWMIDDDKRAGHAAFLLVDGKPITALYGIERGDVAAVYGELARHCGFFGKLDVASTVASEIELTVGILSHDRNRVCKMFGTPIRVVRGRRS